MKELPFRYLGVGWGGLIAAFVLAAISKRLSLRFFPEVFSSELFGPSWLASDMLYVIVFVVVLFVTRLKNSLKPSSR